MADKEVRIEFVAGVEGPHVALMVGDGGIRLAGPKAWGGGKIIHSFVVDPADVARELHLCPQRDLDAARARIKELERDIEYEKQQHGITSAGTDVLVKLAIERCAEVVKAHSEHMYGCYTELDADTDEADRLLADISMLDDITREIRALASRPEGR